MLGRIRSADDVVAALLDAIRSGVDHELQVSGRGGSRTLEGPDLVALAWAGVSEPSQASLERLVGKAVPGARRAVLATVTLPAANAMSYATDAGMAVFEVELDGTVTPANEHASLLLPGTGSPALPIEHPIAVEDRWTADQRAEALRRLDMTIDAWTAATPATVESSELVHLVRPRWGSLCGIRRPHKAATGSPTCKHCLHELGERRRHVRFEVEMAEHLRSADPLRWLRAQDQLWDPDATVGIWDEDEEDEG